MELFQRSSTVRVICVANRVKVLYLKIYFLAGVIFPDLPSATGSHLNV